ncbi:hypothetical protein ABID39_001331 [Bartonella japonica]|uniref:Uncharacterized protein n=1 Tax=Bartonella japonica TaxID=357761 RepID=A0ABV2FQ16_9HYPH
MVHNLVQTVHNFGNDKQCPLPHPHHKNIYAIIQKEVRISLTPIGSST